MAFKTNFESLSFQKNVTLEHSLFVFLRNRVLFVLLCDAVAQGLIQPLSGPHSIVPAPAEDKGKKRAEKGIAKAASTCGGFLDPAGLQDVHKALEVSLLMWLCISIYYTSYIKTS